MEQKRRKNTPPPRYDDAFRAGAVRLVVEQHRPAREVAAELGICIDTLKSWLKAAGVPVMGHIGLMPQTVHQTGGFRMQGKSREQAVQIIADALALEEAGVFALLLESIPLELAAHITARVRVPTIGIGSGPHCDGQILVFHDMIGLTKNYLPKFVRVYADMHSLVNDAMSRYVDDIRNRRFPDAQESYALGMSIDNWLKE